MVKITPILQALLMQQLNFVVQNLNANNFYASWSGLKTLVYISPNTVKNDMDKRIQAIQKEIDVVTADKQQDISQQRFTQTYRINKICARVMPSLLEGTMHALYEGGYLEFGRKEEGGMA